MVRGPSAGTLSIGRAATYLGVRRSTIRRLIAQRQLAATGHRWRRRVTVAELDALMERHGLRPHWLPEVKHHHHEARHRSLDRLAKGWPPPEDS